ncbi:MFS transporter, partial [Streptomyces violarus]
SHNVALPLAAHAAEPSDPAVFMARFWAAWAVGTLLAHQVLKRRSHGTSWGERAFAVGTCAMSLCFVAAFTGPPAPALIAAAVAAGFADGWTEIVYTSRLQAAPDRQRGRLFGLSATAEQSGFALGTIAAAAALEALPALAVVGVFHGAAACGALVLLLLTVRRRDARSAEDRSDRSSTGGEDHSSTRGEDRSSADREGHSSADGEDHSSADGEDRSSTGGEDHSSADGEDRSSTGGDSGDKGEDTHGTSTGASRLPGP